MAILRFDSVCAEARKYFLEAQLEVSCASKAVISKRSMFLEKKYVLIKCGYLAIKCVYYLFIQCVKKSFRFCGKS